MGTRTPLNLSETERAELQRLARRPSTPQALAKRCRVILLDEEGMTYAEIGEELSMREQTVLKWRSRFLKHRMAGLRDAPRPGVKKKITQEMVAEVVRKTLHEKPPDATHWSLRSMEAATQFGFADFNGRFQNAQAASLEFGSLSAGSSSASIYQDARVGGGSLSTSPVNLFSGHAINIVLSYNSAILTESMTGIVTGGMFS